MVQLLPLKPNHQKSVVLLILNILIIMHFCWAYTILANGES